MNIAYPDAKITAPMTQPAMHAYLKDFDLNQRELESAMAVFRKDGQQAALRFGHEAVRQRHRKQYLHLQAPRLLQEMMRGRDVQPSHTPELVDASLKAAGEMFDAIEPEAPH